MHIQPNAAPYRWTLPTGARRPITWFASALGVVLGLIGLVGSTAAEDIRTRTIRVVPSQTWTADTSGSITVAPGVANSDHETAAEFTHHMRDYMIEGLEHLDYTTRESGGDLTFHFTVDVYDPGKAWKRFAIGFGSGNGYVRGTLTIKKAGRTVGKYDYSARLRGRGTKSLAKEVGPTLVLQVHNGEADEELHEYKKKDKSDAGR